MKLIAIKTNPDFIFEKYLYLFNAETILKINKFHFRKDKVVAFTSELLKYYYLAFYLEINPQYIKIKYTDKKRPYLDTDLFNIDFNISHSSDVVVMIISKNYRVGIDIEHIRSNIHTEKISKHVFSSSEQEIVGNDLKNFFTLWTKKESLLKAIGIGFNDKFYINTKLNLNTIECFRNTVIYSTKLFDKYFFSLCILTTPLI